VKFSGAMSGEPEHGAFLGLDSLTLGVEGKRSLWSALKKVESHYPALQATDLDRLIARADTQHRALEHERLAAGVRAHSLAGSHRARAGGTTPHRFGVKGYWTPDRQFSPLLAGKRNQPLAGLS
jgi:hypothetical protein